MYCSHPVRRMREDPIPDEAADLVVELDEGGTLGDLAGAVDDVDGEVVEELEFDSYRVVVAEAQVDTLCEALAGVAARVETAGTLSLGADDDALDEFEG